jgi:hypothetical protein
MAKWTGRQLCSPGLELAPAGTDHFDLDSVDLSLLSVEALDEVFGLASFSIANEDVLLKWLLSLGAGDLGIESRLLSAGDLGILAEDFVFPPEGVGFRDRS